MCTKFQPFCLYEGGYFQPIFTIKRLLLKICAYDIFHLRMQPFFSCRTKKKKVKNNGLLTTNRPTNVQALSWRCEDASKNNPSLLTISFDCDE